MALTPNAELLRATVREFAMSDPTLREIFDRTNHSKWPIGHTACRQKTSGSGNWSDHATSNALDIMILSKWKDPNDPAKGVAQRGEPHYLDLIWQLLQANLEEWDLRPSQQLWRVSQHWNHIHTSFRHRHDDSVRPPCDGGRLRLLNPSTSSFILTMGDSPNPPLPGEEILKVEDLQRALNDAGAEPALSEDGIYGDKTHEAFVRALSGSGAGLQFGDLVELTQP